MYIMGEDDPSFSARTGRFGFCADHDGSTATATASERDIEIDMELGPVLKRERAWDDLRIVSTILSVPIEALNESVIHDAKVIVDREGLDRLSTDALTVRPVARS